MCFTWFNCARNTAELRYDPTNDANRDDAEPKTTAKRFVAYYVCVESFVVCFLDPEGMSQNASLVVLVGVSSLKIPKLSLYAVERNETLHTHSCLYSPQICRLRFSPYFLTNE